MKITINDLDVADKKIFVRVDYNVPLNDKQQITDSTRIDLSLPTVRQLLAQKAKVCLVSHLGRPKGVDLKHSLKNVAAFLSEKIGQPVRFCPVIDEEVAALSLEQMKPGECLLFENIRFYPQETKNDPEFSAKIAKLFDHYVNDAFGTAHRAHASTVGIAQHFPFAAAGLLMNKEITFLSAALTTSKKPYVAIIGGAKVRDKIGIIEHLLEKVDTLLIGGGMAYSFLRYQGHEIGNSIYDPDSPNLVKKIFDRANALHKKILLPVDHIVSSSIEGQTAKAVQTIEPDVSAFDIGPKTIDLFRKEIQDAQFLLWNGPMGVFEKQLFRQGTLQIAHAVGSSQATCVVGGGDSVAAVTQAGVANSITHISTGGGACLEFLEGKNLPGIAVLREA